MDIARQCLRHTLIQPDMYLRFRLINSHNRKVVEYLRGKYNTGYGFKIIVFHTAKENIYFFLEKLSPLICY